MTTDHAATASCIRVHIALEAVRDALDRDDPDDLAASFENFNGAVVAALASLRQQQSKLRRPDQVRVEDDAGGLFATPNLDFFDDMASPQAKAYIDQVAADMQFYADQGFGVDIPPGLVTDEGTQLHTVKGVMDEFAEMDRMEKEFADCMKMGVPDGD